MLVSTRARLFTRAGSFSDPGTDVWTATVNYGDGSGNQPLTLNPDQTFDLSHSYADNASYTITVTISDGDGGSSSDTFAVSVANVAPTVDAGPDVPLGEGDLLTGIGSFTDPGADAWTATVDYGDGTGVQPLTLNPDQTFDLSHTYPDYGTFIVTVTITDDDGAEASDTLEVNVLGVSGPETQTFFANQEQTITGLHVNVEYDYGTVAVTVSVTNGALTLAQVGWLTFSSGDGVDDPTMTFTGSVAYVNEALASITYQPSHDFSGLETLTVEATYLGWGSGTPPVDSASVDLTPAVDTARLQVHPLKATKKDLAVYGTTGNDTIIINPVIGPSGTPTNKVVVKVNGVVEGRYVPTGRILVFGNDGNDTITISPKILKSAWVYGGQGDDIIKGGGGADVLLGQEGNDQISGRGGRDVIIGGLDVDQLIGGGANDLLIGGTTTHDDDADALNAILSEWVRNDASAAQRVQHLLGTLAGGKNGDVQLTTATVLDDALAADVLTGNAGLDWFWSKVGSDTITDPNAETVSAIS